MSLRHLFRTTAVAACILAMAAPPSLAAAPKPAERLKAPAGMQVRVGQADQFSRIEFDGARRISSRREGDDLILTISGPGDPDLALLNIHPPKYVKAAKAVKAPGGLSVRLTLEPGADVKTGLADGGAFVHLYAPPPTSAASPAAAPTPAEAAAIAAAGDPKRPDPRPVGGVVKVHAEAAGGQLALRFPWAAPAGAAVFRRGDGLWVVFDASAKLDLSQAPTDGGFFRSFRTVQGDGFTAVRFSVPSATVVHAIGEGATWAVILGSGPQAAPGIVKVARPSEAGLPTLQADMAGATKVVWINDPVVGDKIAVVTALQPAKGLPSRREYVDMALLPSAHGLAIEPIAEDVDVVADGESVTMGRPKGLTLSSPGAMARRAQTGAGLPQPAVMPAVIDYAAWSKTGSGGFLSRYGALQDAAAEEVDKEANGKAKSPAARMGLARFLVGSQLYFEAIGVLEMTAKAHPELLDDAEYRGLRGAAKVMVGRVKEAGVDFSSPAITDDPSAALWRGYIAEQQGQWQEARNAFQHGQSAMGQFTPALQAKFARADAEAALRIGDLRVAASEIALALQQSPDPEGQLAARLIQAKLFRQQGDLSHALAVYDAVARAPIDEVAVPASLYATQIRLDQGKLQPVKAAAIYDGLRYRWRGDSTEMEVIRSLGALYLNQGRYREAMEVLRSAGQRMPDEPEAMGIQADLQGAFRSLFLDGLADGLEPIQALALFYDFRELTPIGADGDLMVRKLARRLVDVDLLDRAAELLKYQVDNRLDGIPKAQVATDLATIYLMNRQPELAIQAINDSRTTVLPNALNLERRLVEARAWLALNQTDHAVELIGKDASPEAMDMRAEIAWRGKDWSGAGAAYEKAIGPAAVPLAPDQESKLLRAGIAFSLAHDDASLDRLRKTYGGAIDKARAPDALRVALNPLGGGEAMPSSFTRLVAQDDAFANWVAKMKQQFREKPAPVSGGAPKTAAAVPPAAKKA